MGLFLVPRLEKKKRSRCACVVKDLVKTLSLGAAKASEGPERDLENWEQRLKERGKVSVA